MLKTYAKILAFVLLLVGFFVLIGQVLTTISGQSGPAGSVAGVSPEAGESVFWGKGKCGTCHRIGGRGSAVRCPDLENIGILARARADEIAEKDGTRISPTEYLVASILDPSAYVVANYKDEMPRVYEAPIALNADEIQATIAYLQSLGGEVDIAAIKLPAAILRVESERSQPWQPYFAGDAQAGEDLFFDQQGMAGCFQCHTATDSTSVARGGDVGPDLSHVAGVRTPQFVLEAILEPSAEIASGFEQVLLITKSGVYEDGIPVREDEASITVRRQQGNEIVEVTLTKSEIRTTIPQTVSMMPGNYADLLTVQQLHDILAYLVTLQ